MMKSVKILGVFLALCMSLAGRGTDAAAGPDQAQGNQASHHRKPAAHATHSPVRVENPHVGAQQHRVVSHPVAAHHVTRTVATSKLRHPAETSRTVARVREERIEAFEGRARVPARIVSITPSHVLVRMPNGSLRRYVAFRTSVPDRDRLTFRLGNGEERDFQVVRVSRFENRVVVITREIEIDRAPEVTFVRGLADADDEVMLVEPNQTPVPFAVNSFQPLPNGEVALVADDQIPATAVAPNISFVGRVLNEFGNMVTFGLPNGTTRTLLVPGPLPAIGANVAVVENGGEVLSLTPAVTTFPGQVVAVNNGLVTFELPDGATRTLLVPNPVPAPGTRVVVFENGETVTRLQLI